MMSSDAESPRVAQIRERLQAALQPVRLDIVDDSHKHAGHAGAAGHRAVHGLGGRTGRDPA